MQETLAEKRDRLAREREERGRTGQSDPSVSSEASTSPVAKKVGGITPKPGSVRSGYAVDSGQRPRIDETQSLTGNAIENAVDSRFWGAPGIATDALEAALRPDYSFSDMRDLRQERMESLPTALRIGSSIGGSLGSGALTAAKAIPALGRYAEKYAEGLGWKALGKRTLARLAEGGVSGGATALGETVGTSRGVDPGQVAAATALGAGFGATVPVFTGSARWLGEAVGALDPSMPAGRRLAIAALEAASGRSPFRESSAPVPYGATVRDIDTAGLPVDKARGDVGAALRGATKTIAGRTVAEEMLASDAAREAGAMRDAAEHATGVSRDQGSALSVAHNKIVEARELANKEARAAYELAKQREFGALRNWEVNDAAGNRARGQEIADQQARVAAAKNAYDVTEAERRLAHVKAGQDASEAWAAAKDAREGRSVDARKTYRETEALRRADHEAKKLAFDESERGMGDVLDVLGSVGDGRAVPNPHTTLANITTARTTFAEKAFPEAGRSLAGVPYKAEEMAARVAKSPVLQKAWRAAVVKRLEVTTADPSYPPLPTKTVNGEVIAVPDAVAWNDMQQFNQQASETIPGARPLDTSQLAISGALKHAGWLAEGQHPKYQEIDAAFKKSWDEERALVASSKPMSWDLNPQHPNQSLGARLEARATMSPEDVVKDQNIIRAKFGAMIKDSNLSPGELVKRLGESESKESAMVLLGWGPGARQEIIGKLGRPSNPGSYQGGPKPVKEPPVPSLVKQGKYIPSPEPEVEAPIPPWLSAPKPPEVAQEPVPGMVSGREQNFATGRKIFETPMDAGAKDPAFDIPNEISRRAALSAADRATAQQAGGAALQARLGEGGDVSPDANGKFTDQFLAQLGLASKSPQDAKIFEDASRSWSGARALRESLVGGEGPATIPNAASPWDKFVRQLTPSATWTASRMAHALAESGAHANTQGMAAEIVRIVLGEPGSTVSAIKQLRAIRGKDAAVAMKAAGILGRVSGGVIGTEGAEIPERSSGLAASATPSSLTPIPTARDTSPARPSVDIPRSRVPMGVEPGDPISLGAPGPRGLPEVPDGRGLSSLDGLATPRPPVTIEAPRPSVIDRVRDALKVSPLSAAEVGRPKTSAALPGGLVQYTRIGDVPKTFYDDAMDIIRSKEGFVPYVYDDKAKKGTERRLYMVNGRWRQKDGKKPEGTPTIGHGLTDPGIVNRGTITDKESEVLARAHMAKDVAQMVRKGSPISPILVSESYNMGVRRMENKNVFNLLRNGQYEEAADSLATVTTSKGIEDPGLKARRLDARRIMTAKSP